MASGNFETLSVSQKTDLCGETHTQAVYATEVNVQMPFVYDAPAIGPGLAVATIGHRKDVTTVQATQRRSLLNPPGKDELKLGQPTPAPLALQLDGGNVGIGILEPKCRLQIKGDDDGSGDLVVTGRIQSVSGHGGGLLVDDTCQCFVGSDTQGGIGFFNHGWHLVTDGHGDTRWGNSSWLGIDQGGSIELGGDSNTPGIGTPYIDFHFKGKQEDYNTRIINNEDGVLSLFAHTVFVSGNADVNGLSVRGDVHVRGDVLLEDAADIAEDFFVVNRESVAPGSVMVIDSEGALSQCNQAYDKRVAGVISGAGDFRPGITLDKRSEAANRMPVALTGKVSCKVDAQFGEIEVGDLLTTSPTDGHAMKAIDPAQSFGSIIGKALRGWKEGKGLVPILVALQ